MNSPIQLHLFPLQIQLIAFLLIFNFPLSFSGSSEWYDSCGRYFSCGNVTQVGFPFWGSGPRPENCGYPGLELRCEGNATIILGIMGMEYRVLDINQNTQMLTIAREDFWEGICLRRFVNTTLDFKLFKYGPGLQNVTVLYGCPPFIGSIPGQFNCRIDGVNDTFAFPGPGALGPIVCNASVVVPVLEPLASQIGNVSLNQIINHGFKAMYKVDSFCADCKASGGRCGFNLNQNKTSCLCSDGNVGYTKCYDSSTAHTSLGSAEKEPKKVTIAGFILLAFFLAIGGGITVAIVFYFKRRYPSTNKDIEAFLKTYRCATPQRYTYNDLKKITSSFENRLGEGGYGAVYKGDLPNGNPVAVKILKKSKGNAEEFTNEVASIGRTNHVNIVKLLGFCVEGHKRALLYDFMPNGSLDRFIYDGGSNERSLSLEDLFPIAVGIARGLEYLHQGCNTRILHFDIKPHNILLDESFCPKISDFGLAKPCLQKDSIISMSGARGTIGYIAPEVFLRNFGGVSYKSDVYSYGMLVLEMLGCRRNGKARAECSSAQYFPQWIYNQLEQGEELNDEGMMNGKERELHKKMVVVSLWCIQTNPSSRPSMTTVVDMLEGTIESLQIPPMPSLATPPRSRRNSSTTLKISTSATPPLSMNPIQEASMDIKTSHLP